MPEQIIHSWNYDLDVDAVAVFAEGDKRTEFLDWAVGACAFVWLNSELGMDHDIGKAYKSMRVVVESKGELTSEEGYPVLRHKLCLYGEPVDDMPLRGEVDFVFNGFSRKITYDVRTSDELVCNEIKEPEKVKLDSSKVVAKLPENSFGIPAARGGNWHY